MLDTLTQLALAMRVLEPSNTTETPITCFVSEGPNRLTYRIELAITTENWTIIHEGTGPTLEKACLIAWRELYKAFKTVNRPKPPQPLREVEHWPHDPFNLGPDDSHADRLFNEFHTASGGGYDRHEISKEQAA